MAGLRLVRIFRNPTPSSRHEFVVCCPLTSGNHLFCGIDHFLGEVNDARTGVNFWVGDADDAIDAELGTGGDVAVGSELGTIFQSENALGGNLDIAAFTSKGVGDDVAVF